ncbi:hypothetical protein RJT34_04697 [Clitoria ternatea]|uniref:Uncharacterized protein n=1 Tax=Clitoria ternatea TaxID=43366 RepID=A0AAN9Q6G0_CLITE
MVASGFRAKCYSNGSNVIYNLKYVNAVYGTMVEDLKCMVPIFNLKSLATLSVFIARSPPPRVRSSSGFSLRVCYICPIKRSPEPLLSLPPLAQEEVAFFDEIANSSNSLLLITMHIAFHVGRVYGEDVEAKEAKMSLFMRGFLWLDPLLMLISDNE